MKFGRLVISVYWLRQREGRKNEAIYSGLVCEVCGERVKGGQKAAHLKSHPQYAFHTEHREGSYSTTYICDTCNITVGGVAGVVRHYQERHLILLDGERMSYVPRSI